MKFILVSLVFVSSLSAQAATAACKMMGDKPELYVTALLNSQKYQLVQGGHTLTALNVQSVADACHTKLVLVSFADSPAATFTVSINEETNLFVVQSSN